MAVYKHLTLFGTSLIILISLTLILYHNYSAKYLSFIKFKINASHTASWHTRLDELAGKIIKRNGIVRETPSRERRKLNVVFIMTDDMRAQLEPYEGPGYPFKQPEMVTPHLTRLADKSLLLKNAFVQFGLCCPSRTSMLTSRRPDTVKVYTNDWYWRVIAGNYTTLPQYFKENGYTSIGVGKILHMGWRTGYEDPPSWSEPLFMAENTDMEYLANANVSRWTPVTDDQVKEKPLKDMVVLKRAQSHLEKFAENMTSFFLAVGFQKPHAAHVCHQKFYDMYPLDNDTRYLSEEEEARARLSDYTLKEFRRAYYACISFVDSLVGELLDTLEKTALAPSTIITFVSDHGYHYGEHGKVGKSSVFDLVARVPMMLHIPGVTDHGIVSDSIVEAVDLFPTVAEAAGLDPVPSCNGNRSLELCTEGQSFLPLIRVPDEEIKGQAFTQTPTKLGLMTYYSVRTKDYRFSQYAVRESKDDRWTLDPDSKLELYDHTKDAGEYNNVAYSDKYASVVDEMRTRIRKQLES